MELVLLLGLGVVLLALLFIWLQTNSRISSLTERLLDSDRRIQEATTQWFGQIQQNLGELGRTSLHTEEVRGPSLRSGCAIRVPSAPLNEKCPLEGQWSTFSPSPR